MSRDSHLNFFQNFTLNKRRVDDLEKEIKSKFEDALEKLKAKNLDDSNKLRESIKVNIDKVVKESLKEYRVDIKKLRSDFDDLYRDGLARTISVEKEKNGYASLFSLVELLEVDLKSGYEWNVNDTLDEILSHFGTPNGYRSSDTLTSLQKILNKIPVEFSVQKEKIEKLMRQV